MTLVRIFSFQLEELLSTVLARQIWGNELQFFFSSDLGKFLFLLDIWRKKIARLIFLAGNFSFNTLSTPFYSPRYRISAEKPHMLDFSASVQFGSVA